MYEKEEAEVKALKKERDGLRRQLDQATGRNLALSITALGISCGALLLAIARLLVFQLT